jgi:hypothetical protein
VNRLEGPLTAELAAADRDALMVEHDRATHKIDAAFWSFTRCKRTLPPPLAVPDAYTRRAWIEEALRRG